VRGDAHERGRSIGIELLHPVWAAAPRWRLVLWSLRRDLRGGCTVVHCKGAITRVVGVWVVLWVLANAVPHSEVSSGQPAPALAVAIPSPSPLAWFLANQQGDCGVHVLPKDQRYCYLNLRLARVPDTVRANVLVSGGSGDIGIAVFGPDRQPLVQLGRVTSGYYLSFQVVTSGAYQIDLVNTFSLITPKDLLVRYVE
jgi:hypothetical protein